MTPAISIALTTGRLEPAFDWFADSLARQLGDGDDVEVVVVDRHHDAARAARLDACVRGRFAFRHVPPKPTPWQGPHRLTRRDAFAASSARNTAILHMRAPYLAFVDDCAVLMPGWWAAAKRAAADGAVVAGAYQRRRAMTVRDGVLRRGRLDADGRDGRWHLGDDAKPVPVHPGQLYSMSFGAPRELLLSVNGFDEMCDGIGQEDVQLGMRLAAAGATILYDRSMMIVESDDLNLAGVRLLRHDPWQPEAAYLARLATYGVRGRATEGKTDATHMMLDIVLGTGSWATHGNYYWLADLTPDRYAATVARFPTHHWFDGCPLSTL
jgi:hypothetical protein